MKKANLTTYKIAFWTILANETKRIARIWVQTLLPPAITTSLYFIIFGQLIGRRIGDMQGYEYAQYIAPGLIMMAIIMHAYMNVVSSFYGARFQRSIEEMLISPMPLGLMMIGYVAGGVMRGLMVGLLVTSISLFFTSISLYSAPITMLVALLSAILFSLAGFLNALFANKFDDTAIIPTFVLTPLIYLGGVFYSVNMLPSFWQKCSAFNPILYIVNAFRYGVLGESDVNITYALITIVIIIIALFFINLTLLSRGFRIRE